MSIVRALEQLGLTLPAPPTPVASYIPAVILPGTRLIAVSGQVPFRNGSLIATGKIPNEVSLPTGQECARQCVLNGLAAAAGVLGNVDRITGVARVGVFVACTPDFSDHPKVANGASDLLVQLLGERGKHARAAVGCPSLPLNAPVEVEFLFIFE